MKTKILSFVLSNIIALVIGGGIAVISILNWYSPPDAKTLYRVVRSHYVASEQDVVKDIPSGSIPAVLKTLEPTDKQEKKLEKKLGGELPPGKILSVKDIESLCNGGYIVVSLPEIKVGEENKPQELTVTVYEKKQKFFDWMGDRELFVGGGNVYMTELKQNLFRAGPIITQVRIGIMYNPSIDLIGVDRLDYYAVVGVSVKF